MSDIMEGVEAASPTAEGEVDLDQEFHAEFSKIQSELAGSSTDDAIEDTSASDDLETQEAKSGADDGEDKPGDKKNTAERRIGRLTARAKTAEEKSLQLEMSLVKREKQLEQTARQLMEAHKKLQEYGIDSEEGGDNKYKRKYNQVLTKQEVEDMMAKKEREFQERQVLMQEEEAVEIEMENALASYPKLDEELLGLAIHKDMMDAQRTGRALTPISEIAKATFNKYYSRFEPIAVEKNRTRLSAPKPMRSGGNIMSDVDVDINDSESIAKLLDVIKPDWKGRR